MIMNRKLFQGLVFYETFKKRWWRAPLCSFWRWSKAAVNWCPGTTQQKEERFVLSKSGIIQNTSRHGIIHCMCLFEQSALQLNTLKTQLSAQSHSLKFNVLLLKIQQGRQREIFVCLEVVGTARRVAGLPFYSSPITLKRELDALYKQQQKSIWSWYQLTKMPVYLSSVMTGSSFSKHKF